MTRARLRGAWRRVAGFPSRTPLRVQLVAAFLLLGALAMVLFGFVGTARLRSNLEGNLDARLMTVAQGGGPRSFGGGGGRGQLTENSTWSTAVDDSGRWLDANGKPSSTPVAVFIAATGAQARPSLPLITSAFAAAHRSPFTVDSVGSGARWRVVLLNGDLTGFANDATEQGTLIVAFTQESVNGPVGALVRIDLILGAGVLILLGLAAWLVVRASLRPLIDVEHTAEQIAAGDLSRRVPVSSDRTEVGRLGTALNTMLGHIEVAFRDRARSEAAAHATAEQMRRFAADASHELRTPLTSIRGFAELHRAGVIPPGPDTDRAMERIENESIRMGGLVEDLLLLARLDQQRPLERAPVDLLAIAADAVHDAAVIAPDHRTTLSAPDPDTDTDAVPAVVIGDDAKLRQVVTNLVANALHHTPAGTEVSVSVATAANQAVVEVSDNGPGLSAEDAQRVFERFYRTDSSRTRSSGGAGLGLSIVSALVAAHDGTVQLRTALGAGATFRVTLPLAAAARDPAAATRRPALPAGGGGRNDPSGADGGSRPALSR